MTACPQCHTEFDAHDGINTDQGPGPGDATVCAYCGQFAIFTDDGDLRFPTRDEFEELLGQPSVLTALAALRRADTIEQAIAMARRAHARLS